MLSSAAGKATRLTETRHVAQEQSNKVTRKIWLPKLLYDALPYFYLASGIGAFLATLYVSEWFWVVPHYVLFSAACIHFGVLVFRRRHRKTESPAEGPE